MAAISRANELKQLLPGLNALFGEEYGNYENEHEEIYVSENSERSFEEELKLSGFGAAPVKDEEQPLVGTLLKKLLWLVTHTKLLQWDLQLLKRLWKIIYMFL